MKTILSVGAAFLAAATASADFIGIKMEDVSSKLVGATPNALGQSESNTFVFELYANFSNPNDTLQNVFNANINSNHAFYHALNFDGEKQSTPLSKSNYESWGSEVDTFVTIGFDYSGKNGNPGGATNPVTLDPGFNQNAFENGTSMGTNAGWFANPPGSPATKAGTFGDFKILLARFAFFDPGQHYCPAISGSLQLTVKNNGVQTLQTVAIEFFTPLHCPAPPILAAFLLPLCFNPSRRRAEPFRRGR